MEIKATYLVKVFETEKKLKEKFHIHAINEIEALSKAKQEVERKFHSTQYHCEVVKIPLA